MAPILPEDDSEEEDELDSFFKRVMALKAKMTQKGLKQAKCKCDKCAGMWQARLTGPKNHIWLHCDGVCNRRFME